MAVITCKMTLLVFLFLPSFVYTNPKMVRELDKVLDGTFKMWPGGGPVNVNVSYNIETFEEARWISGNFESVGYLRLGWKDPRISFDKNIGSLQTTLSQIVNKLWVPDVFVRNSKAVSQHSTFVQDSGVRILPDGTVVMVSRLTLVIHCPLKLHRFPFDIQRCQVIVESFFHKQSQVRLAWMSKGVSVSEDFDVPDYALDDTQIGRSNVQNYTAGSFQDLRATFVLRRLYGHYLVYWFLPTVLTTALAYLLLWLPEGALAAKSFLGSVLFLVFTVLMVGSRMDSPRVNYMTAIDIWFTVHIFFLFFSVLDVICLHLLQPRPSDESDAARKAAPRDVTSRGRVVRALLWVARVAYPVIYILFLAIFFGIFTN